MPQKYLMIPGLLLQPIVENSVKHGIASKQTGGVVSIKCTREKTKCHIEIKDTGKGFEGSPLNGGFGLSGVSERLDLHYRDNYDLQITSEHGVRVFICIPLKESGIMQT